MSAPAVEEFLRAARVFYAATTLDGQAFRDAPETKRYGDTWAAALARHEEWQTLVKRIQEGLPNTTVGDTTAPYAIAARRCCVYMRRSDDPRRIEPYSIIVGLASVLVPSYHLYWISVDVRSGKLVRGAPLARPREGRQGAVADMVARHLEQELKLVEFPPEYETVRVPDISVGNLSPGEATLLDALFDAHRDNIP